MGWSGANAKKASFGFKNFKMCSLRSVMGCSSDKQSGNSSDHSLSQSLCPLLYNVCSGESSKDADVTQPAGEKEPPEYYQKAYFFEDNDSDDNSVSDISPLIHHPTSHSSSSRHTHIVTGYLSVVEVILLIIYAASLVGLTAGHHKDDTSGFFTTEDTTSSSSPSPTHSPSSKPDHLVAYFCMLHVLVWAFVGIFDRVVQWRHQKLRKNGYLKFYRKMRNVRRLPFIFVSMINAVILLYISLLYIFYQHENEQYLHLHPVDFLYIIVGLELILTLPCLIYYIVRATLFNYAQQPPDVIQDTYSGSTSPTTSVTAVGFRDGEDLDELLERQADMIRYLQQHNANLGRRILELQSQALE